MSRKLRKALSIALAMAMALSSVPMASMASEIETEALTEPVVETEATEQGQAETVEKVAEPAQEDVLSNEETEPVLEKQESEDGEESVAEEPSQTATKACITLTEKKSGEEGRKEVHVKAESVSMDDLTAYIFFWQYDGSVPGDTSAWNGYFNTPYDGVLVGGNGVKSEDGKAYSAFTIDADSETDKDISITLKEENIEDVYVMLEAAYADPNTNALVTCDYLPLAWNANDVADEPLSDEELSDFLYGDDEDEFVMEGQTEVFSEEDSKPAMTEAEEPDPDFPMFLDAEQVLYGSGTIDVYKKGSDSSTAEYSISVVDVPTNTEISLDSPEVSLIGFDLEGVLLSSSLYYEASDGTVTAVKYLMLDDDTGTSGVYVVTPYDSNGDAFDMTVGRLVLDAHITKPVIVDIWPAQINTLCESDGTQIVVGADAMSSNAQAFTVVGAEDDVVDFAKLTGQDELYYGSNDEKDFSLTAFTEGIIKDGVVLPIDKNGNAVEDVELYMAYDHVYSFDVVVNDIVNEHTEDNGDIYLWAGDTYYVDQYHAQGASDGGYTRSQDNLANCGIWVQLGRIREEEINSGSKVFANYANVSYSDMIKVVDMTGYYPAQVADTAEANAPYGIAGPFQFTNGESEITQTTHRVTGHIGDEFSAEEVTGSDIVYMVTSEDQYHTDWINLGAHASDNGQRNWFYWVNDYYFLNNYQDQAEYFEIKDSNGLIVLSADELGEEGSGEDFNVWDIELYTKRDSVIKADMLANPEKYEAYDISFGSNNGQLHHIQLRVNSAVEATIDGVRYQGKLDVVQDEDENGNVNQSFDSLAPYVEYEIVVTDTAGNKSTETGSSYLAMDNEQETKSLTFTGYIDLDDAFDTSKTKILVRINFTGTLYGTNGETITYTKDDPLTFEQTLTEAQLRDAFDTCPNAAGYDLIISLTDILKTDVEEFGQIVLYKIWDDNSNAYNARDNVTEVVVSLERSKDGETWEPVTAKDGRAEFSITGEKSTDAWNATLTNEDLELTYTDGNGDTAYYQFQIASEKDIEKVSGGYEYEKSYDGLTVTNSLEVTDTVEISGMKRWYDIDGEIIESFDAPDSAVIAILQDGEFYDMQVVDKDSDWKFDFKDLPKYKSGTEEHVYTLCELDENGLVKDSGASVLLNETWYIVEIYGPGDSGNDTDGYLVKNAQLHSEKTVEIYDGSEDFEDDGKMIKPGATMSYRITYQNCLDEDATITITDDLQYVTYAGSQKRVITTKGANTEDNSVVNFSSGNGKNLEWTFKVGPYENGYVEFTVTVDDDAYEIGIIPNTAEMKVDDIVSVETNTVKNPVPVKSVDTDNDNDFNDDGLSITVDDEITYDVTYANGYDEAKDIIITDKLDDTVEYVSCTDGGSYDSTSHTITWTLSDVAANHAGSVQFTVKITTESQLKTEVENQASVQIGNDSAIDTNTVVNPVEPQDPEDPIKGVDTPIDEDGLYNNDGAEVSVDDEVEYEVRFYNHNSYPATVTVTDVLDIGIDFVSASDGGTYDEATRTITWTVEDVPAQAWSSVTFKATVNEEALVIEDGADIAAVDNMANVKIEVTDHPSIETVERPTNEVENPIEPDDPTAPVKGVDTPSDTDGLYNNDGDEVNVGDTVEYEIRFYNHNNVNADITITDVLDEGLDFISASDNGTYDEDTRTITWTLTDFAAFTEGSVTFKAAVNETALIIGDGADIAAVDNAADVKIEVADNPDIESVEQPTNEVENPIEPDDPTAPVKGVDTPIDDDGLYNNDGSEVGVGDEVEYEIRFYNHNNKAAAVTVTDVLDAGLDFVSASDGGTYDEETRTITWTVEDVPAFTWGSVTFKATVNVTALIIEDGADVAAVDNKADVKLEVPNDPDIESVEQPTNEVENPIEPDDPTAPVKGVDTPIDEDGLYNNDGDEVNVGDTVEYEIRFYNHNNVNADITITDVLDEGLDFVSASDNGSYDEDTRTITWTLTDFAAFTEGSVTFKATVNETALIVEDGAELAAVDNDALVKIEAAGHPEIDVTEMPTNEVENPIEPDDPTAPVKGVDTPADNDGLYNNDGDEDEIDDVLTYRISFYNHNNRTAEITVTDVLDPGLDFVSASDGGTYDEETRTVTWVIEDVPAFTWQSVTLKASVNEEALVIEDGAGVAAVDNTANVRIEVLNHPEYGVYEQPTNEVENPIEPDDPTAPVKGVDTPIDEDGLYNNDGDEVNVGDTVEYEIRFYNHNNVNADITITDVLDEGLDFISASDNGTYDEDTRTITWTLTDFAAFTEGSVTFKATVNETALIVEDGAELAAVDNDALVKIEAAGHPEIDVTEMPTNEVENPIEPDDPTAPVKGVDTAADNDGLYNNDGDNVTLGELVSYEISFYNHNNMPAAITITDVLDEGLDFVSASDNGTYDDETRTITWVLEDFDAFTEGSVTFTAIVNDEAYVIEEGADLAAVDNDAVVRIEVTDHPEIDVYEQPTNQVENPVDPDEPAMPQKDVDTPIDEDGLYNNDHAEVNAGDEVEYEVRFYNHNNMPATVTITDTVDEGLDFISASDGGTYDEDTRTITWVIEGAKAYTWGSVTFKASVNETALIIEEGADIAAVNNMASVKVEVTDHPEIETVENPTNEVENPIKPGDPTAPVKGVDTPIDDDGLYNNDGAEVLLEDEVEYEIRFYNHYNRAVSATITDVLDIGLDFVSASGNGVYDEETRTITWTVDGIPAYSWASVTFKATVNDEALVIEDGANIAAVDNKASVTFKVPYAEGDPDDPWNDSEGNPFGDIPDTVLTMETNNVENPIMPDDPTEPVKGVDTEIDDDGLYNNDGAEVKLDERVEYEVRFYNHNNMPATVTITDTVDEGLDFISASDSGTYDEDTRTITWVLTDFPAFTWGSVTFEAAVNEEALTVEDGAELAAVDNNALVKIEVVNVPLGEDGNPLYELTEATEMRTNEVENPIEPGEPTDPVKGVDTPIDDDGLYNNDEAEAEVGDILEYEVQFYNHNNRKATVTVTDVLDTGLDFVSAGQGGTYDESTRTITWVIEDVQAFTWESVTFEAEVNEAGGNAGTVYNVADVKIEVSGHPELATDEMATNEVKNPVIVSEEESETEAGTSTPASGSSGGSDTPKTGDDFNNFGLMLTLAAIAALGGAGYGVRRKKKSA